MISYRKLGFILRPIMSQGSDENSSVEQNKGNNSGQQPPAQYVVAEEYTIGVPLFRAKPGLQKLLHSVGASGEIFTKKEICHFLKNYISSRQLYDPSDPRVVYCKDDPLQALFGVEKFTINEALGLISKNCNQVPDTCIKRKYHYVARPVPENQENNCQASGVSQTAVTTSSFRIEVCRSAPIISSSTNSMSARGRPQQPAVQGSNQFQEGQDRKPKVGSKRKRRETSSSDSSESKRRPASVSITYNDPENSQHPWQLSVKMESSDDDEVLSLHGKEEEENRVTREEEEVLSVEVGSDTFSVEYEVESEDADQNDNSDSSERFSGQDVLVLCQDSDVEFWADMSEDGETDTELTDADKWSCSACETKNAPLERHCSLCWKLRPGWLPEKKTKHPASRKSRSHSVPGEVSSSESSDIGRRHSYSKQRKHSSFLKNYDSDSSIDRCAKEDLKLHKEAADSGIGASSATQPSSQEGDNLLKSKSQSPLGDHLEKKLKECENDSVCHSRTAPESPQKLGIRRTFLNYRTKDDVFQNDPADKHSDNLISEKPQIENDNFLTHKFTADKAVASGSSADMCVVCLSRPKTGSIIHGSTGHQVCCFRCARRLKRQRRPCPVCRRTIQKVVKNFIL